MLLTKSLLNTSLNKIHGWSEPEQHPMKRMFLTRASSIGCCVLESAVLTLSVGQLGFLCGKKAKMECIKRLALVFPKIKHEEQDLPIKEAFLEVCKIVSGLASTIFSGIVFSPELNFRFHLQLGLAVDNLAVKKQKELETKLRVEAKAAEITKAREMRFAQFEADRTAAKEAQAKEDAIDAHLAQLLCGV